MVDIRVTGLVKSFDLEKRILDGLSFQVDSGERVGLLGRNGAGKTTVFRMLTGELEPDEGEVQIAAGRRVGLISQIPVYPEGYTVEDVLQTAFARMFRLKDEMDALALRMEQGDSGADTLRRYGELNAKFEGLGGWDTETAVNKVANGLSIPREMRQREFACLSGGEKTRVNLGRLILEDTDILLLDEPTNHLDLQATEWLEGYLRRFRGTVLTISHDRYFLDRTVTRIIEIQDGKAEFYSGNYSFYAIEKERRYQERMKQYLKEQAKIAQLEKAAEQMHLWAFMGNDALHKRAFSMEKRIERMRTTAKPTKARKLEARFQSREFKGDEVLQIKGVSKAFGEKRLFEDVYLRCEGGERIALLGENGTGKTTLLNMLTGSERPDSGVIRLGPAVKAAYLPQVIHFEHPERSILDTMLYELDITPQSARNRLAAYQFTGEDVRAVRRRAEPPAAVYADGREHQSADTGRADEPSGYRLAGVAGAGGGGLRRDAAVREPRPVFHQPVRHPCVGAGRGRHHGLSHGLCTVPAGQGGGARRRGGRGTGAVRCAEEERQPGQPGPAGGEKAADHLRDGYRQAGGGQRAAGGGDGGECLRRGEAERAVSGTAGRAEAAGAGDGALGRTEPAGRGTGGAIT